MTHTSAFKTPEGETAYLAAYDAAMDLWPVPYEEVEIPSRFGVTHGVITGPKDAPPLVLLHGMLATLTMWSSNIADLSREYRVYAIDTMGQPSKSIPNEPVGDAADYVTWLNGTLDGLNLERVSLIGMSYGGWLALSLALTAPERVRKLGLLSPGACFQPMAKQFFLRVLPMSLFPTRRTVNACFGWMGFRDSANDLGTRRALDLMYLGLKHFRIPAKTSTVLPTEFSDDELRALRVPVLLLIGDNEVIYDPAKALDRARRLIPDFKGELLPDCSHDMSSSQYQIVDALVLDFLNDN